MQIIIGLVLGFSLFYRSINYDEEKSPHWTCMPLEMHLYGLHNERVSVFDLSYFVLKQYKAFYRYIFVSCLWGNSLSFSSSLWSARRTRQKAHPLFIYLIKSQRFVDIVSAHKIKVDPLQFQMMYYSYLYEQKWQRRLFWVVSTVRKNASDCTGTSMSCRARFSCLPLSTQTIGYASILTLWYAWTDLYL